MFYVKPMEKVCYSVKLPWGVLIWKKNIALDLIQKILVEDECMGSLHKKQKTMQRTACTCSPSRTPPDADYGCNLNTFETCIHQSATVFFLFFFGKLIVVPIFWYQAPAKEIQWSEGCLTSNIVSSTRRFMAHFTSQPYFRSKILHRATHFTISTYLLRSRRLTCTNFAWSVCNRTCWFSLGNILSTLL